MMRPLKLRRDLMDVLKEKDVENNKLRRLNAALVARERGYLEEIERVKRLVIRLGADHLL